MDRRLSHIVMLALTILALVRLTSGHALERLGLLGEAAEHYRRALALKPGFTAGSSEAHQALPSSRHSRSRLQNDG